MPTDLIRRAYLGTPAGYLGSYTLHCDSYIPKLTGDELKQYRSGSLVVRDGVIEGSRAYVAFHSPAFVRELFSDFEVLEHDPVERVAGFQQDTWVLAKRDRPFAGAYAN